MHKVMKLRASIYDVKQLLDLGKQILSRSISDGIDRVRPVSVDTKLKLALAEMFELPGDMIDNHLTTTLLVVLPAIWKNDFISCLHGNCLIQSTARHDMDVFLVTQTVTQWERTCTLLSPFGYADLIKDLKQANTTKVDYTLE